jgi:hypothetical protein
MKKLFIILVLSSVSFVLFSQSIKISGFVVDNHQEPLSFSNIVSTQRNIGTVTNEKGYFTLNVNRNDTLKISHISTFPKIIPVVQLKDGETIVLNLNIHNLNEVVVHPAKTKYHLTKVGYFNLGKNADFILGPGNQLATYVKNPFKKEVFIKNVIFEVTKKGKCDCSLRIRLLEVNNNGYSPGQDLLQKNVIISHNDLKRTNVIDVSDYHVLMPESGIFVVVEWIKNTEPCDKESYPIITGNLKIKEDVVWYNYRDSKWSNKHKLGYSDNKYLTPNFSLTVFY